MTALEACDKIEEAINALTVETLEEWDWSFTEAQSDEAHLSDYKEKLEKTREHFPEMEANTSMWHVSTGESNATLAVCGNTPTAEARSRYISWVNPHNLQILIARLRELEAANAQRTA